MESDGAFWDERYRSRDAVWSGEPNPVLVAEVCGLTPGSALDAGCGEGADAIWLAQRGWHVTAIDISGVALARARAVPVDAAVARRIEWLQADLLARPPQAATFDLVSVQFLQLPKAPRDALFRGLAAAVKAGGTLLVVGHHPSDLQTTVPRPPFPELLYTAEDVATILEPDEWESVVETSRERTASDRAGRTVAIHDAVLRARRHA